MLSRVFATDDRGSGVAGGSHGESVGHAVADSSSVGGWGSCVQAILGGRLSDFERLRKDGNNFKSLNLWSYFLFFSVLTSNSSLILQMSSPALQILKSHCPVSTVSGLRTVWPDIDVFVNKFKRICTESG